MTYTKCPKCNGNGITRDVGINVMAAALSLGVINVIDKLTGDEHLAEQCDLCNGVGYHPSNTRQLYGDTHE